MKKLSARVSIWSGFFLALFAALVSASCGGSPDKLVTHGLVINTSKVDFGKVSVGSQRSQSITFSNGQSEAEGNVVVTQISISGSEFTLNLSTLPLTLAPGQKVKIPIVFVPKSAGPKDGQLVIQVKGADDTASLPLTGAALAATQLSVSPANMNFGTVQVGDSKSQSGVLAAGKSDVTISTADWSGQGFSLSGISFPVTISAGKTIPFTVTFNPEVAGNSFGSVSFINDGNSPIKATFSGAGGQLSASGHSVDISWQPSNSGVVGYNIYRGTHPGGPYSRLNGSPQPTASFTDNSVQSGATYFYVVTSVAPSAAESGYSNEVDAAIP